jgi:hypothetical protein
MAYAQLVAGAIVGTVAGYYMVSAPEWILKLLGACLLFSPLIVIGAFFIGIPRRGPCPVCNWPMQTLGRTEKDMLCPMCCSYLDAENEKLFPVKDSNRINDEPKYAVPPPWEDLRIVLKPTIPTSSSFAETVMDIALKSSGKQRVWEPKWPPGCCVCQNAMVRKDRLLTPIVAQRKIMKEDIEIILLNIPYCNEHSDSVRMENITFEDQGKNMHFSLLFRSLAYRNAFLTLNPGAFFSKEEQATFTTHNH